MTLENAFCSWSWDDIIQCEGKNVQITELCQSNNVQHYLGNGIERKIGQ